MIAGWWAVLACADRGPTASAARATDSDPTVGTDSDTDTDSDADSDVDGDTDADSDADADTDTDASTADTAAPFTVVTATPERMVATVGPAGGVLTIDAATLTIPAGAVQGAATVELAATAEVPPRGYPPQSPVVAVTFDGAALDPAATLAFAGAFVDPATYVAAGSDPYRQQAASASVPVAEAARAFVGDPRHDPYPPPEATAVGAVPAFVAAGHVGRTTVSCDGGQTWASERSFDVEGSAAVCGVPAPVRCYETACDYRDAAGACQTAASCDCDHHPGANHGVAIGVDGMVASFGWGQPGGLQHSGDGAAWREVVSGTSFGWVIEGSGVYLAGQRLGTLRSTDGLTWSPAADPPLTLSDGSTDWHVRKAGYAHYGTGRWVFVGNEDTAISEDGGLSWWRPAAPPTACAGASGGFAYGNGTILLGGDGATVCASADGGETWALADLGGDLDAGVVFDGASFVAWTGWPTYLRLTSPDGEQWSSTPRIDTFDLGSVAADPTTGVLVAENGGWAAWYEDQRLYRSTDGGLSWVAATSYTPGHDLRDLQFGWIPSGGACP